MGLVKTRYQGNLSAAYLGMIWGEIERNGLWGCEAYAIRNALMGYDGM